MSERPATCECCPNQHSKDAPLMLFMTMWMCPSCIKQNKALTADSESQASARVQETRDKGEQVIGLNKVLKESMIIDSKVEVKTDLFNAETVAIVDIKKAIDDDPSIVNKNGALAEFLVNRYTGYKEKIFANNAENVELANKQNAIQRYLNDLRNKLTEAEREKYKLLSIDYKPNQVKVANKPINSVAKPRKYDKAELLKAATRANVPVQVIQMMCVSKNMTPMQASDTFLNAGSKPIESGE